MATTSRRWAIALAVGAAVLLVSAVVIYAVFLLRITFFLPPA